MAERRPYAGPTRSLTPLDPIAASPGYFRAVLCKGGHPVPARLFVVEHRDPETGDLIADVEYHAEIGLEPTSAFEPQSWPWTPISESEFNYLTDLLIWSRQNRPEAPICNPYIARHLAEPEYF